MIRFMHLFEPSRDLGECDECGEAFDPVFGGACSSCRRLLCGAHYYGSRFQRFRGYLGLPVVCVACRQRARSA